MSLHGAWVARARHHLHRDVMVETPDREAGEHALHQVTWRLWVVLLGAVAYFVAAGYAFARGGLLGIAIDFGALGVLSLLAYLARSGRLLDFDGWLKGYRGERMVADLLEMLSPLGYCVVHGIPFADDRGRTHDIDHAVVGPTGVLAIETKRWAGFFESAHPGRLLHNGRDRTDVIEQARHEAMELKKILALNDAPAGWVQAIVVSTQAAILAPGGRIDFGHVTMLGAGDLVPYIRARRQTLTADQIAETVAVLTDL